MSGSTVRITDGHQKVLKELSKTTGKSMQLVLGEALEEYRTKHFFDALDVSFQALRNDPKAWKEEQAERSIWDKTLADGLDDEK